MRKKHKYILKTTCLKTEEFFTRLNMPLKFTFHWLYYFDAIFIKNIKHVPNSQTLGTKTLKCIKSNNDKKENPCLELKNLITVRYEISLLMYIMVMQLNLWDLLLQNWKKLLHYSELYIVCTIGKIVSLWIQI